MKKQPVVLRLAVLFFIIFGCFNGGLSLINYLYESAGLGYLGQINIALIYGGYFTSNFFARRFLSFFSEVKTALFTGALFYAFTMFSGMFTYYCKTYENFSGHCGKDYVAALNYLANFLLGFFGPTLVWNGQYAFIDKISSKSEKKRMFSVFFTLLQFNYVSGNILNYAFYSLNIDSLYYFTSYFLLIVFSSFGFLLLLPNIKQYDPVIDVDSIDYLGGNVLSASRLSPHPSGIVQSESIKQLHTKAASAETQEGEEEEDDNTTQLENKP